MKTLNDLSDAQRNALRVIDEYNCLFKRRSGWGARGSATVQNQTLEPLVSHSLVRITEVTRKGFTFPVAKLTDQGEVLVEQMKNRQAKRRAA